MDDRKNDATLSQPHFSIGGPLRLATICLDAQSAQRLAELAESTPLVRLQDELSDYLRENQELPAHWARTEFEICLIDFDRNRSRARLTAEKIHAALPHVAVFAVSADSQPELIIQAMRSGCSEYLLKPLAQEQLLQSIARVPGRRKESQPVGYIVAVVGAKGGVGVTMLATHLGAILAKSYSRRALLIDLHPAFGDAEMYLGILKYQYSFRDLAVNAERLDPDLLQSFVLHHRSGLDLLPAPGSPPLPSRATPETIGATIDFLRRCYDVLLIDCPPGMSQETREAIQRADRIFLVAVPEIPAVRDVARQLEYFSRINFPREKISLVVNRWSKRDTITDQHIEDAVHVPIFWKLPNQYYEVIRTINDGDPSARISGSDLLRSLSQLASRIAARNSAAPEPAKVNRGLLALLDR